MWFPIKLHLRLVRFQVLLHQVPWCASRHALFEVDCLVPAYGDHHTFVLVSLFRSCVCAVNKERIYLADPLFLHGEAVFGLLAGDVGLPRQLCPCNVLENSVPVRKCVSLFLFSRHSHFFRFSPLWHQSLNASRQTIVPTAAENTGNLRCLAVLICACALMR